MAEVSRPPPPKRPTIIRPNALKESENGNEETVSIKRPPPKPPNRPPSFRKTEADEEKVKLRNPNNRPARPVTMGAPSKESGGKKKLEITIVSARPMSEVGFRDVSSNAGTQPKKSDLPSVVQKLSPPKSLVPDRSSLPPRPVKPGQIVRAAPPIPVRKDVPTPPDRLADSTSVPSSPTPKPRPHKPPPETPPPKPPITVPWQESSVPLKPRSSMSLPAAIRPLPPTPTSDDDEPVPIIESPAKPERTFEWKSPEVTENQPPAVSSKPKRPTIIRPTKSKSVDKVSDEVSTQNKTKAHESQDNLSSSSSNIETCQTNTPVENDSSNISPMKEKPPVAAKPKPTILPKPKPKLDGKENETNGEKPDVDNISDHDKPSPDDTIHKKSRKPTIIRANVPRPDTSVKPDEVPKSENMATPVENKSLNSVHQEAVINDNEIPEYASIHKTGNEKIQTKIEAPVRKPPPPVPAKRFTPPLRKARDDLEIKSAIDEERVETRPKPAARARPASMMVKTNSSQKPPPPNFLSPNRPPPLKSLDLSTQDQDGVKQKLEDVQTPPVAKKPEKPSPPTGSRPPKPPTPQQTQSVTTPDIDEDLHHEIANKVPPSRPSPITKSKAPSHSEDNVHQGEDSHDQLPSPKPTRPKSVPHRPPQKPAPPSNSRKSSSDNGSQNLSKEKGPALPARPGPGHPLYHYMLCVPHGLATHDYEGSNPEDLSFKANDIISLVRRIDDSWLLGQVGETTGIFPQNFIQILRPFDDEISLHVFPEQETADINVVHSTEEKSSPVVSITDKHDWVGAGPRCVARFDFDGEGSADLCFEEGDYIRLVEKVDSEWAKGELHGKVGIFPLTFVEVIEDLPGNMEESSQHLKHEPHGFESVDSGHSPTNPTTKHAVQHKTEDSSQHDGEKEDNLVGDPHGTMCQAIADFHGDSPGDLGFHEGDIIEITGEVDDQWLRGRLRGAEGIFPATFVSILEKSSHEQCESSVQRDVQDRFGEALYDFNGENDNELSFKTGERIKLGATVEGADDWQWGEVNGHTGMFPAAFVQEIS